MRNQRYFLAAGSLIIIQSSVSSDASLLTLDLADSGTSLVKDGGGVQDDDGAISLKPVLAVVSL